jgi:ABC-type dipeptide/oligopeptide/nickel transport system permease component
MLINPVMNRLGLVRDPAIYALEMERLGLNQPVHIQLFNYLRDFFTGNWGASYTLYPDWPVFEIIYTIFPKTIELMIIPIFLIPIIAVKLGVTSAKNRNHSKDILIRSVAIIGAGFPSFWIAGLLQYIFGVQFREATFYQFDIDIAGANSSALLSSSPVLVPTQFLMICLIGILLFLIIGIILIYLGIKLRKKLETRFKKQEKLPLYLIFGLGGIIIFTITLFFLPYSFYITFLLIESLIAFIFLTVYVILSKLFSKNPKEKKYRGIFLIISGLIIGIIGLFPILTYLTTYGTQLRIIDSIIFNDPLYLWDTVGHLFLPTIAMTIVSLAGITRQTRASMLDVLNQDYIRTARAKGVPEKQVINKHALRNALIPTTNLIIAGTAGALLGSVFIETIFNYKGFGFTFFDAIMNGDIPVINGCILFATIIILIGNLLADVMYTIIDPRIIYS